MWKLICSAVFTALFLSAFASNAKINLGVLGIFLFYCGIVFCNIIDDVRKTPSKSWLEIKRICKQHCFWNFTVLAAGGGLIAFHFESYVLGIGVIALSLIGALISSATNIAAFFSRIGALISPTTNIPTTNIAAFLSHIGALISSAINRNPEDRHFVFTRNFAFILGFAFAFAFVNKIIVTTSPKPTDIQLIYGIPLGLVISFHYVAFIGIITVRILVGILKLLFRDSGIKPPTCRKCPNCGSPVARKSEKICGVCGNPL
jgi:hypothetical protein